MAFSTKYKTQFQDWNGDTITVEIQENPFTGTAEEFTSVGNNPCVIEHQTNLYTKESYIVPSKATISVYINIEWDLNEFLYATDRQFKVIITDGSSNELFRGWVVAGINSEEYKTGFYIVTIVATDGLADLKNIKYLNAGALYDAYQYPLTIIQNCLDETGMALDFWENNDIYAAAGMTTTTNTHSPLNQSYIHSSAYGSTTDNILSCWDVLNIIGSTFHCRFFQDRNIDTANEVRWYMSKLDVMASTKTYRHFLNAGTYDTFKSFAPLLTIATDVDHVGGSGRISMRQAYKEINQAADRVLISKLLAGTNFDEDDFDGSGVLNDWTNPTTHFANYTITAFTANSSGLGGYIEGTDEGNTVLKIRPVSLAGGSISITSTSGGGATVTVTCAFAHGFATNDLIHIWGNSVKHDGAYQITVSSSTVFTFASVDVGGALGGECIHYETIRAMDQRIAYHEENGELSNDGQIEVVINAKFLSDGGFLPIGVYAELGTGSYDDSYYITDKVAQWQRADNLVTTNGAFILITNHSSLEYEEFKLLIDLDSMNLTSAEIFLVICSPRVSDVWINSIEVRGISADKIKTQTTSIESNNTESLDYNFHHPDSDGAANEEFKYNNPIYDDASPKLFINSWKEAGGAADNLEDIIQANLAAMYDKNSQIWNGSLEGDITVINSITDPLNFDREFQLQKIKRNLLNTRNDVAMIEVVPQGDLVNASVTITPETEWTKGTNSSQTKDVTVINNGNIDLVLTATIETLDSTYFTFVNPSDANFNLAVGASKIITLEVNNPSPTDIFSSLIKVEETRSLAYATSATGKLAHISIDTDIYLRGDIPTVATIVSALGGGVLVNTLNGGSIPQTNLLILSVFTSTIYSWNLNTYLGASAGTMRLRDSGGVFKTQAISSNGNATLNPGSDYFDLIGLGWDGNTDLYFEVV